MNFQQFAVGGLGAQLPAVKQLFLSGQYRQCAADAQSLLRDTSKDEPHINVAYLHFYTALSHHELSRNMHLYNDHRQASMDQAESHYLSAIASLSVLSHSNYSELEPIEEGHSEYEGSVEEYEETLNPSNSSSITRKRSSLDSNSNLTDDTSVCSDDESDAAFPQTPKIFFRSPPSRNFLDDLTLSPQKHRMQPLYPIPNPRMERYNVQLTRFVNMLHSHIDAVRSLRQASTAEDITQSISQGWHKIANTTSSRRGPSGVANNGSKQFVRGRARLLPRERFDPKKYEELCRKALAEL